MKELNLYQNNIRNDVLDFINLNPFPFSSILEIGGGGGYTSRELSLIYKTKATNIDIHLPLNRSESINHIQGDICENLTIQKLKNINFDLVLALDVIEHIKDTKLIFQTLDRITKRGNKALVSLPNVKNIRIPYNIYLRMLY